MHVTHEHFRLLAAFQVLAGMTIVPFLRQGVSPVIGLCAGIWLVLGAVTWLLRDRRPLPAFEMSLYASMLVITVHAANTPRPPLQVLDGLEMMVLGMMAAFALPAHRVTVWLVTSGVLYLGALIVNPLPIGVWLGPVIVALVVGTTTVVRRLIQQVRAASHHDPLTGALNRLGLAEESSLVQAMAIRTGNPVSVAFLDLDDFKAFNDSHGHAAGDQLLVDVVSNLQTHLRATDLIARIGGDEFVLVLPGVAPADQLLTRTVARLPMACTYGATTWDTTASLDRVIDDADRAMYRRKPGRLRSPRPYDGAYEHH